MEAAQEEVKPVDVQAKKTKLQKQIAAKLQVIEDLQSQIDVFQARVEVEKKAIARLNSTLEELEVVGEV